MAAVPFVGQTAMRLRLPAASFERTGQHYTDPLLAGVPMDISHHCWQPMAMARHFRDVECTLGRIILQPSSAPDSEIH